MLFKAHSKCSLLYSRGRKWRTLVLEMDETGVVYETGQRMWGPERLPYSGLRYINISGN